MNLSIVAQIEERIHQLSLTEQLWLIERLAQHLRTQLLATPTREEVLAAMAADPDIQREIQAIEKEFAPAAADGLEPL